MPFGTGCREKAPAPAGARGNSTANAKCSVAAVHPAPTQAMRRRNQTTDSASIAAGIDRTTDIDARAAMETVMEMPMEAVVVAVVMETASRRGAGRERGEPERSNGGESECKFLHGHLQSMCDAIRCGWFETISKASCLLVGSHRFSILFSPPIVECDPAHAAVVGLEPLQRVID